MFEQKIKSKNKLFEKSVHIPIQKYTETSVSVRLPVYLFLLN